MPYSDVDLHVVLRRGRKPSEYSYFDHGIYVGIGFDTLKELRGSVRDFKDFFWIREQAASSWIFMIPVEQFENC